MGNSAVAVAPLNVSHQKLVYRGLRLFSGVLVCWLIDFVESPASAFGYEQLLFGNYIQVIFPSFTSKTFYISFLKIDANKNKDIVRQCLST